MFSTPKELLEALQRLEELLTKIPESLSWAVWLDGFRTGLVLGILVTMVLLWSNRSRVVGWIHKQKV